MGDELEFEGKTLSEATEEDELLELEGETEEETEEEEKKDEEEDEV